MALFCGLGVIGGIGHYCIAHAMALAPASTISPFNYAQILGAIRAAVAPPQINYLHLGLRVLPGRLTTGPLAALGEWQLDLRTQTLRWFPLSGRTMALSTQNTTQRALTETVVKVLRQHGVPHEYHLYPGEGHGWRRAATIAQFYETALAFVTRHVLYA